MRARLRGNIGGLLPLGLLAISLHAGAAMAHATDCATAMVGSISADPTSVAPGAAVNLFWTQDGPNECPLWINDQAIDVGTHPNGTVVVHPQTSTDYILTTSQLAGGKHELDRVRVSVVPDCVDNVSGTLSALPKTVHLGAKSELTWFVQAPDSCQLGLTINGTPVGKIGSLKVQPNTTTVYSLVSAIPGAPTIASATVSVNPKVVYIRGNSQSWKDLLVQSVGEDGTTVILMPTVNMDLTGYGPIYIRESVTLTGDTGAPATPILNEHALGPLIYTTSRPKPLFLVKCNADGTILGDNVHISGFRLHGPHFGIMDGDANLEKGISVDSCLNVDISKMEVAGWSGSAIYIGEAPDNMRMFNPDAVHIHDNFLHNNQHVGGNGYGVDVSVGAYAKIERNLFDLNRHAITASGGPGTGYWAEDNLILKGGGVHGTFFNTFTHVLDVHGDKNCPSNISAIWNCGHAGDQFWFIDNAVQFTRDYELKIRGLPRVAVNIEGNVFANGSLGSAVALFTHTNVSFGAGLKKNITGYDTYGHYGVCDLDGDHRDDLFLATGKTWWYSSAAKMNWVFLKAATERLEDVGLGDFNGDGRCDVIAPSGNTWEISPGGRGAWTKLPGTYSVPFNQLRFADFNGDGRTDVFRRDPNGQWWVVSPGVHGWQAIQSSSIGLGGLRFGDFTGDGKADVLSRSGGHWSISRSGTGAWTKLNNLNTDIAPLLIADVDGDHVDDIVRFHVASATKGTWEVSWGGRTAWKAIRTVTVPAPPPAPQKPLVTLRIFIGRFDGWAGADLLHIDYQRVGRLFDYPRNSFGAYNLFPY